MSTLTCCPAQAMDGAGHSPSCPVVRCPKCSTEFVPDPKADNTCPECETLALEERDA